MRKRYNNPKLKFYLGDVRDYQSVLSAVNGVDFIFHAAALKQVPSCEFHPLEAVKTNILGTENVLEAAIFEKVKFGKIKIKISKEYNLAEAKQAHADLEARKLTGPAILIP